MLSENSQSDFNTVKKAEYYDADGYCVADEENKHKLNKPEKIEKFDRENKE